MDPASEPMPEMQFEEVPCSKCGAITEKQAETTCRPRQDITGEYVCPGEFQNGRSVRPTAAGIAALDAWCTREMELMEAAHAHMISQFAELAQKAQSLQTELTSARNALEEERERCAKACEDSNRYLSFESKHAAADCAARIRALPSPQVKP